MESETEAEGGQPVKKSRGDFRKHRLRNAIKICGVPFYILSIVVCIGIGSVPIEPAKVINILGNLFGMGLPVNYTHSEEVIILYFRIPRVLMAAVVGGALAVAGVAAQTLFKNPIADPYIIGISSSAGFGAAFVSVTGIGIFGIYTIPFFSFVFALFTSVIIYFLAGMKGHLSVTALLLSGIAVSYIFSALISFILFMSQNKSHMILTILMGKFWGATWDEVQIVFMLSLAPALILYFYGLEMNIMGFGEETARSTGVNTVTVKTVMLICMTLLTAAAVAFCGTIGFVGLVIPNLVRLVTGNDVRKLIPISALAGGILLMWADAVARTLISPMEIPVGIFTSFLGGPFFIYMVVKNRKKGPFE